MKQLSNYIQEDYEPKKVSKTKSSSGFIFIIFLLAILIISTTLSLQVKEINKETPKNISDVENMINSLTSDKLVLIDENIVNEDINLRIILYDDEDDLKLIGYGKDIKSLKVFTLLKKILEEQK